MSDFITESSLSFDFLRKRTGHKYDYGHVLVVSGEAGQTGAARLAARGALRIGAGLVTLATPPDALVEVAAQTTAVMLKPLTGTDDLEKILQDRRINTLVAGPAMGLTDDKGALLEVLLKAGRAMVLDADALTLLSRSKVLTGLLHERCVLTPHAGEFARLFPDLGQAASEDNDMSLRQNALEEAVKASGCSILLKGAETLISAPARRPSILRSKGVNCAPWLATAGSGDVLAGFIGGCLARGSDPFSAAIHAAWLHAECARTFGPGLIAEDLPEVLPKVLARILLPEDP